MLGPLDAGARAALVAAARRYLGTPYQWGGGHAGRSWGLDCSGLVIQAAADAGVAIPDVLPTANGWFQRLPRVTTPRAGDLAFYGPPGRAQHVVLVTGPTVAGAAPIIGATGGDKSTTTPARALEQNANVRESADHRTVRRDFLGFGSLDDSTTPAPASSSSSSSSFGLAAGVLALLWWLA